MNSLVWICGVLLQQELTIRLMSIMISNGVQQGRDRGVIYKDHEGQPLVVATFFPLNFLLLGKLKPWLLEGAWSWELNYVSPIWFLRL